MKTRISQGSMSVAVAFLLSACGGGGGGGETPTEPPGGGGPAVVTVEVRDDTYEPRSVTITPGTTVRWVMRGSHAGHTVTHNGGDFDSGFVFQGAGDTFERRFSGAEEGRTFEYACVTHRDCCDMKGSVRVGENAPPPGPGY